jgi:hypothetical protein
MGVNLRWIVPENDCNFDFTYIYRSNTEDGTYTEIANQSIDDNTYCDPDGVSSHWYKIRFYNSVTSKWSNYSEAMQGGEYAGYSSVTEVRAVNNLTEDDISDTDLFYIIQRATAYLNVEINQKIKRERVQAIDNVRTNKVDGINKTFYVQKWNYHLADMNNDGKVTGNDLIVYEVDSSNTEKTLQVKSVSPDEGEFTLYNAPAGGSRLYVTYEWSYVSEHQPHALVKLACEMLSSAFAFEKIERGMSPQQFYGNVRLWRDMAAGSEFHKRYREVVTQINSEMIEWKQSDKTF